MVSIHGISRIDWFFDFWGLDDHHLIAIARGPLVDAIPSFRDAVGLMITEKPPSSSCTYQVKQKTVHSLKY